MKRCPVCRAELVDWGLDEGETSICSDMGLIGIFGYEPTDKVVELMREHGVEPDLGRVWCPP